MVEVEGVIGLSQGEATDLKGKSLAILNLSLLVIQFNEKELLCWTREHIHPQRGNTFVDIFIKYVLIVQIHYQYLSVSKNQFSIDA